jgi:hypothetical protein
LKFSVIFEQNALYFHFALGLAHDYHLLTTMLPLNPHLSVCAETRPPLANQSWQVPSYMEFWSNASTTKSLQRFNPAYSENSQVNYLQEMKSGNGWWFQRWCCNQAPWGVSDLGKGLAEKQGGSQWRHCPVVPGGEWPANLLCPGDQHQTTECI